MTVDAIGTHIPTVFDAGLPPIAYEHSFGRPVCRGRSRWGRTGPKC
jgi:hypothetical protein